MNEHEYIRAAEGATDEQKEIVVAGNQAIHAVLIIAAHHEICPSCFASFVAQLLNEVAERSPHEDDLDAGHA